MPKDPKAAKFEDMVIEKIESEDKLYLKEPGLPEFDVKDTYKFKILPKID